MIIRPSQSNDHLNKLIDMERTIREKALIHNPLVQSLIKVAYQTQSPAIFDSVTSRLCLILESYDNNAMRQPDDFRPYCPKSLSITGSLHLIDQIDGLPIFIDHNKLVTGLGIFGPQGSGKSYGIIDFCNKIQWTDPNIKITIVDPKGAFSNLAAFQHIDMADVSFDLTPPSNVSFENFIYELMPILANAAGLIYSLDMLYQAMDVALGQYRQYIGQTDIIQSICLKDIFESLSLIKVRNFRKTGYHDAATTALSLILGRQNLFSCRKGISLNWLFSQNVVLNAHCLTDDMQCRFFAIYLFYWLYQQSRYNPETNQIKHIVIIDDASRFIGAIGNQFDSHSKTSPLGHILAVLRSAGICFVYATQLPAQVDPAVLSLTRNALVIGNINGESNLGVIQGMMSLGREQKAAITRFKNRETLAFISGHDWPHPIHGWTPNLNILSYTTNNPLRATIDIVPWHSLSEMPQRVIANDSRPASFTEEIKNCNAGHTEASNLPDSSKVQSSIDKLVLDCIHYPFSKARDHAQRMDSFREYDTAKTEAVQNGLLIASKCGKSLYLIPTQIAYDKFGITNPYRRATSIEHAFYVLLAANALKTISGLTVNIETPIGSKGAAIDVTAADKSGNMTAYEVTLSTSNLSSNASKLQNTAYKKIVWLCRDADTAKAVKAYFNKSTFLPSELVSKFEYVHFGKFVKKITRKNT